MSPEEVREPVQAELPNVETIEGHVARITFRNDDTGYTIFRVDVAGLRDPVSVLGVVDRVAVGEHVTAEGQWENSPQWGRQLRAQRVSVQLPVSRRGTARYLASRLKGIGPKLAERISARFGDDVLRVIDHEPERLLEVPGIGQETLDGIQAAWTGEKRTREVMIWLEDHGLGSARAAAVFRKYGEDAARIVEANPYRLIADIRGIGFAIADNIARTLGITGDAPMRLQAGLYFVLATARDRDGHCGLPEAAFIEEAVKTLGPHEQAIRSALAGELAEGMLVRVEVEGVPCVFTDRIHRQERTIAKVLAALQRRPLKETPIDVPQALEWVQRQTGLRLARDQEHAVGTALTTKVAVVTGGPGVGKTTILNSVLRILRAKGLRTHLCAPTGRAARRLSETSGLEAKTIHRLLEFDPNDGRFRRNRERLLETDLVVVDEVSMVDVPVMASLLQAIPDTARLLLVGDVDQLPSVGPGHVLSDIIRAEIAPVETLRQVHRQAEGSQIVTNAHRVNSGAPLEFGSPDAGGDFLFVDCDEAERAAVLIVRLVAERIPARYGRRPDEIQVLTPMRRTVLGTEHLNDALRNRLNGQGERLPGRGDLRYAVGDRVMQVENNYEKEVYNGDIGMVQEYDPEERLAWVRMSGQRVSYGLSELGQLQHAYAVTIHKSQGSEYPVVVVPMTFQHRIMLRRNLLYTAVTRAKSLVVLVGQRRALERAIGNDEDVQRCSSLRSLLIAACRSQPPSGLPAKA